VEQTLDGVAPNAKLDSSDVTVTPLLSVPNRAGSRCPHVIITVPVCSTLPSIDLLVLTVSLQVASRTFDAGRSLARSLLAAVLVPLLRVRACFLVFSRRSTLEK